MNYLSVNGEYDSDSRPLSHLKETYVKSALFFSHKQDFFTKE